MAVWIQKLLYFISIRVTLQPSRMTDFPIIQPLCLHQFFHSWLFLSFCVPTVLFICSTGISTCCPSATAFALTLGPDLPREDQLYSGNLRYSAEKILTSLSLLIPAFSLVNTPLLLTIQLQCVNDAPLPLTYKYVNPQLRCYVLAPDIFGARPLD